MKLPKSILTTSLLAAGLFLAGCGESRMAANEESAEVPAGTQFYVRVNENTDAKILEDGDSFQGTLERPVQVDGKVIIPEGTPVKGEVTNAPDRPAGNEAGDRVEPGDADRDDARAAREDNRLGLELTAIVLNGRDYSIDTHSVPVPGTMNMDDDRTTMRNQDRDADNRAGRDAGDRAADAAEGAADTAGRAADSITGTDRAARLAGQQFVFTLEDETELPWSTNMRTE